MKESKGIFTSKYINSENNNQRNQKQSLKTSQILTINHLENKGDQSQIIQNKKYQYLSPHIQQLLNSQSRTGVAGFINSSPPYINYQNNPIYLNQSSIQNSRFRASPMKSQVLRSYIVNDQDYLIRKPLNQIKTVIHTPIPIIHPIIYESNQIQSHSQGTAHNYQYRQYKQMDQPIIEKKQEQQQEKEKLQLEINLIMQQYTKLYEKYEQLVNKQPQLTEKIVYVEKPNINIDDYSKNNKNTIINTKKIQQSSYIFQEMEKSLNNRLDKISQERLREGLAGIHRIKQQNSRSFQINYY